MSVGPLPASLAGAMTDREAIADTIYRAVLAFDHADESLLVSAITEDCSAQMPGAFEAEGLQQIKSTVFDRVSKLDTLHLVSNVRVNIESDTTAKVTCSACAQHVGTGKGTEPGSSKFTSGSQYLCEVVKVGDLWKIKKWDAKVVWVEGDPSVMAG